MTGHTGFVNVQYRKNKIIEVGLRPARSGMYLIGANCPALSKNIYNVIDRMFWDASVEPDIKFKPFYVYKCYTRFPAFYLWPQPLLDTMIRKMTDMPLYEYYFEPVNNEGIVFFQFMHRNHTIGMRVKKLIEILFAITQLLFICAIIFIIYVLFKVPNRNNYIIIIIFIFIWFTRFLNPMYVNYNCYKAYAQMFQGKDSLTSQSDFDNVTEKKRN